MRIKNSTIAKSWVDAGPTAARKCKSESLGPNQIRKFWQSDQSFDALVNEKSLFDRIPGEFKDIYNIPIINTNL